MFRKRRQPAPPPSQPGYWPERGRHQEAASPAFSAPASRAIMQEPQRALLRMITLLVLSNYQQCAQELSQALERAAGSGRYYIMWVATLEQMLEAMTHYRYDICLLDLGSSELKRLEENRYQLLGEMPYVAVLNMPFLNTRTLQGLETRGYYGYVGYPFDGQAVDSVLQALLQAIPERRQEPQPPPGSEQPMNQATGSWPAAPANQTVYQAPSPAGYPRPDLPMDRPGDGLHGVPPAPAPPGRPASPTPALSAPLTPPPPPQRVQPPPPTPRSAPLAAAEAARAPAITTPLPPLQEPGITTPPPPSTEPPAIAPAPAQAAPPAAPVTPATPVAPAAPALVPANADLFAIQPQLVRHRGLFVCWSPFDGAQRTIAALNLATALAFGGFRTLVGELRRPAGPLNSYLQLTKEELSRSLLAAAYASERLLAQKGYVLDQELLENHLLNAIPLDPRDEESPEVHFFLSGPSHSPQLLFNTPALDSNQSPFVPELLQMVRQYWDFAFIVVGSSPVDKLHWQAFRSCDRLLVFLPPDEAYLTQAGHLLPPILRAANISPSNVDVILTQIDRGLLTEQMDPILRFLAKTTSVDDRQPGSIRAILPRKQAQLEEKQLRLLERQLRKIAADDSLRSKLEEHVKAILKACGLEDKLAGVLPDALPLMQSLRRKNRLLLPLVMQREFISTPYVSAIRDLLEAWIQVASNASAPAKRSEAAQ